MIGLDEPRDLSALIVPRARSSGPATAIKNPEP